jgi:hypothetical protein
VREYCERGGGRMQVSGRARGREARAPIVPKKFFHTLGNFREHEERSKNVNWSHEIAPWIVFFKTSTRSSDRTSGRLPEHLTDELDYGSSCRDHRQGRQVVRPKRLTMSWLRSLDITARDIQRREMRSGVFLLWRSTRSARSARGS